MEFCVRTKLLFCSGLIDSYFLGSLNFLGSKVGFTAGYHSYTEDINLTWVANPLERKSLSILHEMQRQADSSQLNGRILESRSNGPGSTPASARTSARSSCTNCF